MTKEDLAEIEKHYAEYKKLEGFDINSCASNFEIVNAVRINVFERERAVQKCMSDMPWLIRAVRKNLDG